MTYFCFSHLRWWSLLGVGLLWSCADNPAPPSPPNFQSSSNADTSWMVTSEEARTAAEHVALIPEVRAQAAHSQATQDTQRVFAGRQRVQNLTPLFGKDNQPFVYVATYEYGGWALVAADEHMPPILAFSEHGTFGVEQLRADGNLAATVARNREAPTLPEGLLDWLMTTHGIVAALRQSPGENTPAPHVKELWRLLVQNPCSIPYLPRSSSGGQPAWNPPCSPGGTECTSFQKGPYLRTTWGQGCGYNDQTWSGASCNHSPTGCVPTAMAQVMAFHRYPASYSWSTMPLGGILAPNSAPDLAWLMRYCGDEVGVSYGNTSSGANSTDVPGALKSRRFGYSSADHHDGTVNYRINNDLDAGRPSLVGGYRGSSNLGFNLTGGHLWVCDGMVGTTCTTSSGSMFSQRQYHMNWGWASTGNGYFASDDWQVTTSGTSYNYQYNHHVVVNIHP